uniref:Putative nuclease HARBI1 n=1 Tax=Erpetoichthys calabaricus TaxID=27687 RepID=A0A8C4TD40_ERPCA
MAGVVHRYHRLGSRKYRERMYAEHAKPLAQYTTEELYARFRFGRDDIKYIADLVRPKLQHKTKRSPALFVEEQCLIALRFYASGTFYQVVGNNMGVDKSTVSNVVKAVSVELASLVKEFVSFPKDDQMAEWQYVNRKGRHSINVQSVANADLIITNCVLQSNRPNGIILGDSAYPLLPWLMTTFPVANTPEQAGFNSAHCKTRCAIECLNGVLKRCFACLNYLQVEPKVACNIILACIVLHNIATRHNVPLDDIYDGPEPDEVQPPMFTPNEGQTGRVIRDAIVRHYF